MLNLKCRSWDGKRRTDLFKFYEQFLLDYEKKVNSGLRVNGTRSKYKILLKHLRNFALTKYGYSDVSFNDLTPDFVQDFDYYLRDDQSLTHNTIWLYMIGFTTLCRLAMSRKHLAFNPFSEYKNTKRIKTVAICYGTNWNSL